jgi:dolichyl-phosphate beta-glucosyltransferase
LVVAVGIWLLSYVVDWLHELELGASNAGAVPYMEDPSSFERVQFPSVFEPASKYLSLVMPAYNEQDRIRSTLDETFSYLQERVKKDKSFTYEIIIVDDGSKDNTTKIGFEYINKYGLDVIRVLKQGVNQGKGAAVRKGMLCSRGQLLLMLDADGASRITDLEKLEAQILQSVRGRQSSSKQNSTSKVDIGCVPAVAFGSRAHLEKQALATRKWYRNFLMKAFHLCVLLVAGPGVRDTQCGFKMFTRSAAQLLFSNLRLKRWCFDVELVYLCKRLRIPVSEVSVTWAEIPGSKVRFFSFVHMLLELVLVRLGYGFHIWKIHTNLIQD